MSARYYAWHFLFSLRDWAVAPLFLPLLASLYRGWMCVKAIVDDVTPWADPSPKITVAMLELPPWHRTVVEELKCLIKIATPLRVASDNREERREPIA